MGFCPLNVRASLAERWRYKLPWLATEAVSLQRETARSSWDYSAARFRGLHPPNFWFENKFVQVLWTSGRGCVVTNPVCTEMTATFDLALEVKGQIPT